MRLTQTSQREPPAHGQDSGHADRRGRAAQNKRRGAEEVERDGDDVGEQGLASGVALEPDPKVGVIAGLLEEPDRVQGLGPFVAVEPRWVVRQVRESEDYRGRHDRGHRRDCQPEATAPQP
jgi:hypothetical protein